ncbi:MAG: imidazole glycerol phosphate synthase subunit HisF [Thermoguttaceae bacterium]|nr:imidazole glycerol phosphate synthase subunit HisF [Thermoguttaceae bacterium]
MIILPAIDIKDGNCVRLVKGDYGTAHKVAESYMDTAKMFESCGAQWIHMVDLDGAKDAKMTNKDIFLDVAKNTKLKVEVGGGIRTVEDFRKILNAGADKVSINSSAVKTPDLIGAAADRFGSQCVVVNIDPKRVLKDGKEFWEVFINGGRIPTGLEAVAWAREVESRGAGEIVLTSMDGDGTKNGYDLPILKAVADAVRIPVVASGGAGEPKHFVEAITEANASAVLAASVFHYGLYSIAEVKEAMRAAGVPVRV